MTGFLSSESWWIERLGWILIHSVWQLGVIGVFTALTTIVLRRSSAKHRYVVLVTGMLFMLVSPVLTSMWLFEQRSTADLMTDNSPAGEQSISAAMRFEAVSVTDQGLPVARTLSDTTSDGLGRGASAPTTLENSIRAGSVEDSSIPSVLSVSLAAQVSLWVRPWLSWIVAFWVAGLCLFMIRTAIGLVIVQRLRRRGTSDVRGDVAEAFHRVLQKFQIRTPVRLLQSALISAPVVVGCLRPVILLPLAVINGLTIEQVEAIIAHELAHVRRFDAYVVTIQAMFEALFFFHPAAWWISGRLRLEREYCCDDLAVSVMSNRMDYSRALLAISEMQQESNLFVLGADGGSLMVRVQRLFGKSETVRSPLWGTIVIAALTILLGSILWMQNSGDALASSNTPLQETEESTDDDRRVFVLRGKVLMPDGSLAKDGEVVISHNEDADVSKMEVTDGHFEIHTRGLSHWYFFNFRTKDGGYLGNLSVSSLSLRQLSTVEQTVQLDEPRILSLKVVHKGHSVSGASVQVNLAEDWSIIEKSNADGLVYFAVPADQTPYQFAAWTEDGLTGGLIPSRVPTLHPTSAHFELEVHESRNVRVRAIDPSLQPVGDLMVRYFEMNGGHYEVTVGQASFSERDTDQNGEALFPVPDLPEMANDPNRYVVLKATAPWIAASTEWLPEDSTLLVHLKPKQERVTVEATLRGQAPETGGLLIELKSFEAEIESRTENLHVRTDDQGNFTADVLPGSTYVVYVNDQELVSNIWHGEIVSKDLSRITKPEITVREGVTVDVKLTQGDSHEPVRNAWVQFESPHEFEYETDDGQTEHGVIGRRFSQRTDENGKCSAPAAPGPLKVRVSQADWEKKDSVTVPETGSVSVVFHRPISGSVTLKGQLKFTSGESGSINGSRVRIVAMDNDSRHEWTAVSDVQGQFSAAITSTRVAIFATSPDGQFSGCSIVDHGKDVIEVPMYRTVTFGGHVLGDHDAPIEGADVRIIARRTDREAKLPQGMADFERKFVDTLRTQVKTDASGYFEFLQVPQQMELTFYIKRPGVTDDQWDGRRWWLEPGEEILPPIFRLTSPVPAADQPLRPIETVMNELALDCKLSRTHGLIVVKGLGESVDDFVSKSVLDDDKLREVGSYLPKLIDGQRARGIKERVGYFEKRGWAFPDENQVLLIALNEAGEQLGANMIDVTGKEEAALAAATFVKSHAPPQQDAKKLFDAALAEAKKSNRRVWVTVSQTRCAPCISWSRWLDSQKQLLEKDYVIFKFDDVRDLNGIELACSLELNAYGVPCHKILDADGQTLINSIAPFGNIGLPSGQAGSKHLRKMLNTSRQRLTDKEINAIVVSITAE